MFSKLVIFSAALLVAAPLLAANSGGAASSGASTASLSSNSGGHAGGSVGGGGGGHGGGSFGAHSAAMSTHLGGAGHTLHAATAHALTSHATQSQHAALLTDASKKPGHGHDHESHIFLHRAYGGANQWAWVCLGALNPADGRWSDCSRPSKANPNAHS